MAARLNPRQDENTRSAIKTRQLVNRLQAHAFFANNPTAYVDKPWKKELSATQLKAIEILLRKTLPDLTVVSGNVSVNYPLFEQIINAPSINHAEALTIEHSSSDADTISEHEFALDEQI